MQMRSDTENTLGMNVPLTTSESTMHPPQECFRECNTDSLAFIQTVIKVQIIHVVKETLQEC